jgi:6-phosphogluconolactonase (cycloisomerase 2 family)
MSLCRISRQGAALAARASFTLLFLVFAACSGGHSGGSSPTLQSLEVTPTNPSAAVGVSEQFVATGIYSDASHQDLTAQVTWLSSSSAVATISSGGMAHGMTGGTTTISASMQNVSGSSTFTVTPAVLNKIEVTPSGPSLAKGSSVQLTAMGIYSDNSTKDLTGQVSWSTSSTTVASVSTVGMSTGLTVGNATISATSGKVSGSTTLNVTAAVLKSIEVTPQNPTLPRNFILQFTAMGVYTDNTTQNISAQVTWASSQGTVASINSSGLATSIAAGKTIIAASLGNVASGVNSSTLTVTSVALTSIAITPANPSVPLGTTQQLKATGSFSDNSTMDLTVLATWNSSQKSVATVSNAALTNGLATPVTIGVTSVTAILGPIFSPAIQLTVTPATLASIAVTPASPSIALGLHQQYAATGTYSDGSTRVLTGQVTWSSSNTGTATVSNAPSSQGLATSVGLGATAIGATLGAVSGSASLNVTAAQLVSIAVTPANATALNGGTAQFAATGIYTDSSTQNLTSAVTWSSSNASIATISNAGGSQGLASAVGSGAATVRALLGGISGGTTLTVMTEFAYVPNFNDGTVSAYAIGSNGALTANGTPNTVTSGAQPYTSAADPKGRYVYVADESAGTLSQYTINADGTLAAMNPASIAAGTFPRFVVVDPTGTYVYVANSGDNTVAQYAIGTDGTLTAVPAGTVVAAGDPVAIAIDPSDQYAYVVGQNCNCVSQYTIGAGGVLSPMNPSNVGSGNTPTAISIAPNGQFAYVVNSADDTVSTFAIGAGGALQATGATGTQTTPESMAISPNGLYAYVANYGNNDVELYSVNSDGSLTPLSTPVVAAGSEPSAIGFDPSGSFLYVVNSGDDDVLGYAVNADGSLTALPLGPVATGVCPLWITTTAH